MTNVYGSSSSSGPRGRGKVSGVPQEMLVRSIGLQLILKSSPNPYRRYYRCCYAADEQLKNDDHVLKWVNKAHLNEIQALQQINGRLKKEVKEMLVERNAREDIIFEKVQMRLKKEISEKIELVLFDSASGVKKTMISVVIVCMVMTGCSKFVG